MSSWNYRIATQVAVNDREFFIIECYYDDSGRINGYSTEFSVITENIEGLVTTINQLNDTKWRYLTGEQPIIDLDSHDLSAWQPPAEYLVAHTLQNILRLQTFSSIQQMLSKKGILIWLQPDGYYHNNLCWRMFMSIRVGEEWQEDDYGALHNPNDAEVCIVRHAIEYCIKNKLSLL